MDDALLFLEKVHRIMRELDTWGVDKRGLTVSILTRRSIHICKRVICRLYMTR